MKPRVRLLNPDDFDRCWAISRIRTEFSHAEVNRLRLAWAYLLPRDEMRGVVVEDVTDGNRPRVVAFGASVFVSDEWMLKLREDCRPFSLTRALLEAGSPVSGILNFTQIGLYNAGQAQSEFALTAANSSATVGD